MRNLQLMTHADQSLIPSPFDHFESLVQLKRIDFELEVKKHDRYPQIKLAGVILWFVVLVLKRVILLLRVRS
jgi:hypothetical protein